MSGCQPSGSPSRIFRGNFRCSAAIAAWSQGTGFPSRRTRSVSRTRSDLRRASLPARHLRTPGVAFQAVVSSCHAWTASSAAFSALVFSGGGSSSGSSSRGRQSPWGVWGALVLLFSNLLFSSLGNAPSVSGVTLSALAFALAATLCLATLFAVSALPLEVSPLWRSKLTSPTPPAVEVSQPTASIASAKPVTPARRSSDVLVTRGALPSSVWSSNHRQTRKHFPKTASGSMPRASAIASISGLSGVIFSILSQSPAMRSRLVRV